MGTENAVLTGTNRLYYVPDYVGCLSIKTVVSGSAVWEAGGRRFVVHENCYLILNDGQSYTMTIESARRVTTFCVFFKRGLVEDVFRSQALPDAVLLDEPEPACELRLGFWEKLETQESGLHGLLGKLRGRILQGMILKDELEEDFYGIAAEMVREHQELGVAVARLPAIRAATREELYRRLLRGRDYMLSTLDRPVRLCEIAREACLSPYHFHRVFTRTFRETPHKFLTRQRMAKARALLKRGDRSITEACLETGFESLTSFSSLFRKHFGISPREFQRASLQK
ncbi:MAG: helix-turn-helix transcriptional regulator [Acidobacteria bacterium]|nr:helix-turn-helix transcriptional regulator [Acidobacteriota bacterium]